VEQESERRIETVERELAAIGDRSTRIEQLLTVEATARSARLVFHVPADMRVERLVAWDDSVSTGPASYERNVAFVR
jgi:hypothetical protein